ncbi:MAG TPA: ATP-dependent sacrificial sulfur transferase LarE [Candidatus Eremiobacteraceae bacterium]|nr:ATP-dependent sacrificial sulfur transferase LarE [Candidatus Eremiobacteraceae bacterium]
MIETDLESSLRQNIHALGSVVVAYSGGVDSAVVLAVAAQELGERALGITGISPSIASGEADAAIALAREIGARHETIATAEFDDERYRANPVNRCYFCKDELYGKLDAIARERGFVHVADGFNADDGTAPLDIRPGRAAAVRLGVRSPLAEAGVRKADVRAIAARLGLRVSDKPATPCLSSRIPHGTRIELDVLRRIDLAEQFLRASGFPVVRVRHFGRRARVEVPAADIDRLQARRANVERALHDVGYSEIEVDPRGYRVGSLNESNP